MNHNIKCCICNNSTISQAIWNNLPASSAQLTSQPKTSWKRFSFVAGICNHCNHIQNNYILSLENLPKIYDNENYIVKTNVSKSMNKLLIDIGSYITENLNKPIKGLRVLEIGSGSGELAHWLSDQGAVVYTIDPSIKNYNLKKIAHYSGMFDSSYPHNNFDLIIARHLLEHIANPKIFLKTVLEKIKLNGILYIETPNSKAIFDKVRPLDFFIDHIHHFSENSLTKLVRESNWSILKTTLWLNQNYLGIIATPGEQKHIGLNNEQNNKINELKTIMVNFENKINKIKKAKSIILYGAGAHSATLTSLLDTQVRKKIVAVWDRDLSKHGKYLPGLTVPVSNIGTNSAELIVNTGVLYCQEIENYLYKELKLNTPILHLSE